MSPVIDLNCDLGEGCANDAAIMPWITSANIACGAHAGDEESMRATLRLCRQSGVVAGAHPGYADREHFGRRELALGGAEIADSMQTQLERLRDLAREEGVVLAHVKPHGALYNQAARDPAIAKLLADTVQAFDPRLILVGLAGSELPRAGLRAGLRVAHEAFADRRYQGNGALASRELADAVIDTAEGAAAQALDIVLRGEVDTRDGTRLSLTADTLCLHGDGRHAANLARSLRATLDAAGVAVRALH
jgi:UPF0271 protein